ncbi:MAG: DNA methyltransferase [Phycisphaerae bacterium]|nr:DNA methyltransferase [Phycisphaerae bacterium]
MRRPAPVATRNGSKNKLAPGDRAVHDWYRFVLSFPPHLVAEYVTRFGLSKKSTVLDPFCGTGTTLVECKKLGIPSVGIEAHPMSAMASAVKTDWAIEPDALLQHAQTIAECASAELKTAGFIDGPNRYSPATRLNGQSALLRNLAPEANRLLLTNSISPIPLHKSLTLLEHIRRRVDPHFIRHEFIALASALVQDISNLHFGPEVGVTAPKTDVPVIAPWLSRIQAIAQDARTLQARKRTRSKVIQGDSRTVIDKLSDQSIDAVITSPPYPNEKDYTRTTRLESVILGLIRDKTELRKYKQDLIRSNTRNVYRADDDDTWVVEHPEIRRIAAEIERRRIALGKTSGFERMYHRVTKLYFGGMAKHFAGLRQVLRPGAQLAYVVGDQASYLRVMIRTGSLLAEIASSLGYELVGIDLFRTRLATATREQLREEVVVLRWPG